MEQQKIVARIIIEILGMPKDHVETTMKNIIIKLKNEEKLKLLKETTYETEQIKQFYSTFSELEIEVYSIEKLIGIIFDYMPSSIEIFEPQELNVNTTELAGILNDLIAKLHRYDAILKNLHAENMALKKGLFTKEDIQPQVKKEAKKKIKK